MAIDINIPSQVRTFANLAAFPATGALKTIYIAEDTNKTYRWTGSVYVEVSAAGATGITIGTTAITSGTVGRVLFEGTGNVVQESANLFWDNTNGRLGVGGTPGAYKLDVLGVIKTSSIYGKGDGTSDRYFTFDLEKPTGAIPSIVFGAYDNNATRYLAIGGEAGSSKYATQFIYFFTGATNTTVAGTRAMAILPSGNVNIGSTVTDAGFRLDVNGTARVQSGLIVQGLTIGRGGGNANSVAIGLEAAPLTTATQNCAVGYRALFNNTGGDNTAVGAFYAMFANTTGTRNTGIGAYALNGNTTGQYNTAIGYNTSSGNFSNSTILGYGAAATADNQFVVGSSGVNAGAVTTEVNASTQVWNVVINGVARKILLA